jgi:hypothetical protein
MLRANAQHIASSSGFSPGPIGSAFCRGPVVPAKSQRTREHIVPCLPYIIIYEFNDSDKLTVLAVFHGAWGNVGSCTAVAGSPTVRRPSRTTEPNRVSAHSGNVVAAAPLAIPWSPARAVVAAVKDQPEAGVRCAVL